jgi:hypothetical protein
MDLGTILEMFGRRGIPRHHSENEEDDPDLAEAIRRSLEDQRARRPIPDDEEGSRRASVEPLDQPSLPLPPPCPSPPAGPPTAAQLHKAAEVSRIMSDGDILRPILSRLPGVNEYDRRFDTFITEKGTGTRKRRSFRWHPGKK